LSGNHIAFTHSKSQKPEISVFSFPFQRKLDNRHLYHILRFSVKNNSDDLQDRRPGTHAGSGRTNLLKKGGLSAEEE